MAKTIQLSNNLHREVIIVDGVYNKKRSSQNELYRYCADYYYEKYRSIFYAPDDAVEEIFQEAFIKLWENIESRKIYVENNLIKGKNCEPLKGSIRTYFMGISRIKYLEWVNKRPFYADPNTEMGRDFIDNGFDINEYLEMSYGDSDSDNVMYEIISDSLSKISSRCYEIITKYYYEYKKLDSILQEIPSIESKDALKTKKHKCMESLRAHSNQIYQRYKNYYC